MWDEEEQSDPGIGQDCEITDCVIIIVTQPWVIPFFSPGEMQGEGRKWIGSFGTESQQHQPSGPDNSACGEADRSPGPRGL